MVHATEADYLAWTGEASAPADIDTRLAQASLDIDLAILVAYDDTDADVIEALKSATVVHASREFDPTTGDSSEYERIKLGPLELQKAAGLNATQRAAVDRLVPLARDILTRAGLLYRGAMVGRAGFIGYP